MSESSDGIEDEAGDSGAAPATTRGAKPWKSYEADVYKEVASKLVHFSTKTVNSNASAGGIRLGPDAGLDLPYVSARTLMSSGVRVDLDYTANVGGTATVVKQINAAQRNDAPVGEPSDLERQFIATAMEEAHAAPFTVGIESVDARLRQILIPKPDARDGYVAVTPLTAGGVCHLLLDSSTGLLAAHNGAVKEERTLTSNPAEHALPAEHTLRKIHQARFGLGGSNPQNVGGLVRSMQRPIHVGAPGGGGSTRAAFALYYEGIRLDLARAALLPYRAFRISLTAGGTTVSTMEDRNVEEEILRRVCDGIQQLAAEALDTLRTHAELLPQDHQLAGDQNGEYELVSRKVSGVVRGLIDKRLRGHDYRQTPAGREIDWPRETAQLIAGKVGASLMTLHGEQVPVVPLDARGRNSVAAIIEEYLR